MKLPKQLLIEAEKIHKTRPLANEKYDQVYMRNSYMLKQMNRIKNIVKDKKIVFLGDGDCTSVFIMLFIKYKLIKPPVEIMVLDFDNRILNYILRQIDLLDINVTFETRNYNVINALDSKMLQKFDLFYINPPYGSKNSGASIIAWLHRCMDLCKPHSFGIIICPFDNKIEWTVIGMQSVQKFMLENGYIFINIINKSHQYHDKKISNLFSSNLIVERIKHMQSEFSGKTLPEHFTQNLYGKKKSIPKYILDDNSTFGKEVF